MGIEEAGKKRFRNGIYTTFNGKEFSVRRDRLTYSLSTKDVKDVEFGFQLYDRMIPNGIVGHRNIMMEEMENTQKVFTYGYYQGVEYNLLSQENGVMSVRTQECKTISAHRRYQDMEFRRVNGVYYYGHVPSAEVVDIFEEMMPYDVSKDEPQETYRGRKYMTFTIARDAEVLRKHAGFLVKAGFRETELSEYCLDYERENCLVRIYFGRYEDSASVGIQFNVHGQGARVIFSVSGHYWRTELVKKSDALREENINMGKKEKLIFGLEYLRSNFSNFTNIEAVQQLKQEHNRRMH